jgi:hypothetical protein
MPHEPRPVTIRRQTGDPFRRIVLFLSRGRGVTLGHRIFLPDWCADDPAVLAHEMEHVRQYEEWGALRYYTRGVKEQAQHLLSRMGLASNPYDWRRAGVKPFEEYGMEQQGQLVEDAARGDGVARDVVDQRIAVNGQRSTVDRRQ